MGGESALCIFEFGEYNTDSLQEFEATWSCSLDVTCCTDVCLSEISRSHRVLCSFDGRMEVGCVKKESKEKSVAI